MMELLDRLVSKLGITEEQARSGTGLLLAFAKERLGSGEFSTFTNAIPEAEDLVSEVPSSGEGGGLMGKLGGALGGSEGGRASLAGGFSKLGIDPVKTQKFVAIVKDFLRERSPQAASALSKAAQGGEQGASAPTSSD